MKYTYPNDLYSEYIKNSYKNLEKGTYPIEKWAKELKKDFINNNIQVVNKNTKICLISLVIRGMNIMLPSELLKLKGMTILRIGKAV